jgi:hypothetical protein
MSGNDSTAVPTARPHGQPWTTHRMIPRRERRSLALMAIGNGDVSVCLLTLHHVQHDYAGHGVSLLL